VQRSPEPGDRFRRGDTLEASSIETVECSDEARAFSALLRRCGSSRILRLAALLTPLALVGIPVESVARPETIRPGHSYFSDDYVINGLVRDIVGEKNLEEVYQFYSYYEAVYDDSERVVRFTEYKRGEVLVVEAYRYGADGSLVERLVEGPGAPPRSAPQ
jgi:hypothetical protein